MSVAALGSLRAPHGPCAGIPSRRAQSCFGRAWPPSRSRCQPSACGSTEANGVIGDRSRVEESHFLHASNACLDPLIVLGHRLVIIRELEAAGHADDGYGAGQRKCLDMNNLHMRATGRLLRLLLLLAVCVFLPAGTLDYWEG
jgi:hypothetical protein